MPKRVSFQQRLHLTEKTLWFGIFFLPKTHQKQTFLGEIKSPLHVWQQWAESARLTDGGVIKMSILFISLHSTNEGCCFGQAYYGSILCVMVIVATDGSRDVFALHAEAEDVEERARSFIITRQGRPFILPLR